MKMILFIFICFYTSLTFANTFNENSAKAIFESRCSICHPLEWSLERRKTKKGWKETVERMRKKTAGNVISDEDVVIITEYLYKIRGK
ncbi:MAG: hypothetical protein N2202_06790 [Proteobacteria bacterium]|nr:hypothetical protein [Pseudomonadota bacterium]